MSIEHCISLWYNAHLDANERIPQLSDTYQIDGHKIHYHLDRLEQWKNDPLNTFPIYVEISPVGQCNHRCTFCAVDYIGYVNRQLKTVNLKSSIKNMADCGVRSIMFAGEGEPLLHPQLGDIINYTKSVGVDVGITTNGTAMNEKFVRECIHNIDWIKISLNAGCREDYVNVHKTKASHWDMVWDNIQGACDYILDNKYNTVIGTQAVLIPDNALNIHRLCEISKSAGCKYTVIKPYSQHNMSLTKAYKDIMYGSNVYDTIIDRCVRSKGDGFDVIVRKRSMNAWDSKERGYSKCYSTPYFWAYIMATGDVYGCSAYLQDDRFKYGNIYNESFRDIWTGKKRQESMHYVNNELNIKECRKNCRMNKVNQFLWDIKHPGEHKNFI